jgi:hypothetical protein
MSGLTSNTLKRFSICYKKEIDSKFKKHFRIDAYQNEKEAIEKTCAKFEIPIKKIGTEDNKEGYIYCNNVYNPTIDNDE